MNNKNNEGKTFGDIFSKIDNNMLNNNDNKKKDSDNAVLANKTFNSIFDKAVADVSNDKESVSFSSVFNVVKDDENTDANKEKK